MKAKSYVRLIQHLERETKECFGQAECLKNAVNNLSNENAITTIENLIIDLMDKGSEYAVQRLEMMQELSNVADPLQYMVLHYRYCFDYGWNKIAYKLKSSVGFVKNIHGEALQSLDKCLENCCNAEEV